MTKTRSNFTSHEEQAPIAMQRRRLKQSKTKRETEIYVQNTLTEFPDTRSSLRLTGSSLILYGKFRSDCRIVIKKVRKVYGFRAVF